MSPRTHALARTTRTFGLACALAFALVSAAAAATGPDGESLVLVETREIGAYRVETWGSDRDGWRSSTTVRVVPPSGAPFEVHDAVVRFVEHDGFEAWESAIVRYAAGDDLTGDGVPNLLIEGYSMGAHCCFTYHLLSLGDDLRVLWRAETRDSAVVLVDLRGDGGRQLLMNDMSFAYEFCSFADSPAPTVVLQVQDAHVVVANSSFPEAYDRDLAWALERALERLYLGSDAASFRDALWATAQASPWYLPAANDRRSQTGHAGRAPLRRPASPPAAR